jgi:hypothetical protein
MVIVIISASFGFGLGFAALGRLFVGVSKKVPQSDRAVITMF